MLLILLVEERLPEDRGGTWSWTWSGTAPLGDLGGLDRLKLLGISIKFSCMYFLMYDKNGVDEIVPSSLKDQFRDIFPNV